MELTLRQAQSFFSKYPCPLSAVPPPLALPATLNKYTSNDPQKGTKVTSHLKRGEYVPAPCRHRLIDTDRDVHTVEGAHKHSRWLAPHLSAADRTRASSLAVWSRAAASLFGASARAAGTRPGGNVRKYIPARTTQQPNTSVCNVSLLALPLLY